MSNGKNVFKKRKKYLKEKQKKSQLHIKYKHMLREMWHQNDISLFKKSP